MSSICLKFADKSASLGYDFLLLEPGSSLRQSVTFLESGSKASMELEVIRAARRANERILAFLFRIGDDRSISANFCFF